MRKLGLYIHIPFCVRKCNYCDFYSLCSKTDTELSDFVNSLCEHIARESSLYRDCEFDSIFIGGGTPSLMSGEDLSRLVSAIKSSLKITQGAEFSIEANPGTLTAEKLNTYKKCGVNRLSIGLQSSSNEELKCLGRIHTLDEFLESFRLAREAGFDNINVDIMYALPSQTTDGLFKTLDFVCGLSPEHISAYCLKIEEGTPFFKARDSLCLPDDELQEEMYCGMCDYLKNRGYEQYEISNFSKKGFRCAHNLKYWRCEEYVGFGPSAHSYFDGERYFYSDNLTEYMSSYAPQKIMENAHTPDKSEKMDELVMLRLRLSDGIDLEEFRSTFGIDFDDVYDVSKYIKSGHMVKGESSYSFTSKGFFVSNYILCDILDNI